MPLKFWATRSIRSISAGVSGWPGFNGRSQHWLDIPAVGKSQLSIQDRIEIRGRKAGQPSRGEESHGKQQEK